MPLALLDLTGHTVATVPRGAPLVLGRAVECDVSLTDPTISRKHAELRADDVVLVVRDLGSRNGTFHNGERVEVVEVRAGEAVTFGALTLHVADVPDPRAVAQADAAAWYAAAAADARAPSASSEPVVPAESPPAESPPAESAPPSVAAPAPAPVAAEVPNATAAAEPPTTAAADSELPIVAERGGATPAAELAIRKLALLLDVAKGLGGAGEIGALLERIVAYAFETLDADRAAILLADDAEPHRVSSAVARDRWGADLSEGEARAVPRSIVRAAIERKAALLSVNAADDPRFGGWSVLQQRVRSAMCAPLLASDGVPLGVLYVDSANPERTFDEAALDFLSAFAGIAAAALETTRLAERVRREALARGNFERYFAPPVAARIARSTETMKPGGERRRVTVLFGDLRGFTRFASGATPDVVADTISEFLSAMVDCVFRHGGTLDKFIGDAVMAQWGAPEEHPDDPDRAMRAALDMIDALDAMSDGWKAQGRATLAMGIGMSYGEVFAGNIGSERRLEFTVLGDAVNQAAKLCDGAGPNEILVSDALRRVLCEPPPLRVAPTPPGVDRASAVYAVVRRVG